MTQLNSLLAAIKAQAIRKSTRNHKSRAYRPLLRAEMEALEQRLLLTTSLFQTQQTFSTGIGNTGFANLIGVATDDFNHDNKPDLAVLQYSNVLSILLGNSSGGFQAPITINVPNAGEAEGLAVGDLNGDHFSDVIVSTGAGVLYRYINQGNGTFVAGATVSEEANVVSLHIADVNGDGRADVVYANGGTVGVMLQNTAGNFSAAILYSGGPAGDSVAVAVGDLNGDGHPDIVASNHMFYGSDSVGVLINNGSGAFASPVMLGVSAAGPAYVTLADLNGDHVLDIINLNSGQSTANSVRGDVDVFLNNGSGSFAGAVSYGGTVDDVALADMNGDGQLDLLTSGAGYTNVFIGATDGTFHAPISFAAGPVSFSAMGLVTPDINGDTLPDVVLVSRDATSITDLINTGAKQFEVSTPNVALHLSSTSSIVGSTITLTATVTPTTPGFATPTGTVTFFDNPNYTGVFPMGTITLSANGDGSASAVFSTSSMPVGNVYFSMTYNGDSNYNIRGGGASATITPVPVPPTRGAIYLPHTAVTAGVTMPMLQVALLNAGGFPIVGENSFVTLAILKGPAGAVLSGTHVLQASNGLANFTGLSVNKAGTYTFQATDGALKINSGTLVVGVDTSSEHLVLAPRAGSAIVGTAIAPAIVVDLEDQFANPIISDHSKVTLSLADGPVGGVLGGTLVATVVNGVATFSKATLSKVGSYTLTLTDSNVGIPPIQFTQSVLPGATIVAAPKALASYVFGSAISLATTFKSSAPAALVFTGSATIVGDNGMPTIPATLTAAGAVKFAVTGVAPGTYTCTVNYPGDANHTGATSPAFTLHITPAATTTTLKASSVHLVSGQALTLTATVNSVNAPGTARTGTVTFFDGLTQLGRPVVVDGTNKATLLIAGPTLGSHSYTAVYSGDVDFKSSTSAKVAVTVKKGECEHHADAIRCRENPGKCAFRSDGCRGPRRAGRGNSHGQYYHQKWQDGCRNVRA